VSNKKLKNKRKKARGEHSRTIYVGVSGGVDSSVSLALLKDKGFDVTGVFIRTWQPDFIECTWQSERRDAIRVCAHLGVPFLELNLEKEYKKYVADYLIEEYRKGKTPNPDIMCNREIKFGSFLRWAMKEGADFIATGHYAQIGTRYQVQGTSKNEKIKTPKVDYKLEVSKDEVKDQTYFLWTLNTDDLKNVMFPVGDLTKDQVRKLAKKYGLPTAEKKDSQGICMMGLLDVKDFLKNYIKIMPGNVLDEKGEIIGTHNGVVFLTLGERHGFTINKKTPNDRPYYIIKKDLEKNTITVSHNILDFQKNKNTFSLEIEKVSFVAKEFPVGKNFFCRIRHRGELIPCGIKDLGENRVVVDFKKDAPLVSSGQSIVLYKKQKGEKSLICLGGGIVV
jgi:tRNA-uridine 2-sulfurtransferase